jgi:hypothetical protein
MILMVMTCPYGQSDAITKRGPTMTGTQRCGDLNPDCLPHLSYSIQS